MSDCNGELDRGMVEWWMVECRTFSLSCWVPKSQMHNGLSERSWWNVIVALYLDLKWASDTVGHDHVLDVLLQFGIRRCTLRCTANFLSEWKIFFDNSYGRSREHALNHGVPQNSVLSPTLFNLVMHPLYRFLPPYLRLSIYADDICIWPLKLPLFSIEKPLRDGLHHSVIFKGAGNGPFFSN